MEVLRERLDTVQRDLKEIKNGVKDIDKNQRKLSEEFLVACEQNAHRDERLDKHDERIKAIEDAIKPMIFAYKILAWVGTLLGGSIFVLVWMVITGQVQLVFP